MKELTMYQVDAFTNSLFKGNPAAVCPLTEWISEETMQSIASENNLSETAFFVKKEDFYEIRWFTPVAEVDLCGHATLASAFVLFFMDNIPQDKIIFKAKKHELSVIKNVNIMTLDFPSNTLSKIDITDDLIEPFNFKPIEAYKASNDILLVFSNEEEIKNLKPNFTKISNINTRGIIVTAKGENCDFVSRFFAPKFGINEDPVTGSAHTTLIPYWSKILGKKKMTAKQLSKRGGDLLCEFHEDRVKIAGEAVLYMEGKIKLPIK